MGSVLLSSPFPRAPSTLLKADARPEKSCTAVHRVLTFIYPCCINPVGTLPRLNPCYHGATSPYYGFRCPATSAPSSASAHLFPRLLRAFALVLYFFHTGRR